MAKRFNGEIISADSRQLYKGLDVGTEKISKEEMNAVPHHLIDIVSVDTVYTAFDFKRDAEVTIREITSRGNLPIIAGGTFFYIDTLLGKITSAPVAPNATLRSELEQLETSELFLLLQKKDARRANDIDKDNRRRLIRALEILEELGHVPVSQTAQESNFEVLTIGIQADKTELRTRLRARAQHALQKGLIEETKKLIECGVSKERLSEIGHEYKVALEYLDEKLSDAELIQKLEEKNWQYAKRQLMWLKRDESIKWFERDDVEIFKVVERFLK